jgi:hypothetical protein
MGASCGEPSRRIPSDCGDFRLFEFKLSSASSATGQNRKWPDFIVPYPSAWIGEGADETSAQPARQSGPAKEVASNVLRTVWDLTSPWRPILSQDGCWREMDQEELSI